MERFKARKALWADLEAAGLALKKDSYTIRCRPVSALSYILSMFP
jgi:hypothetical protein